MVTLTNECPEVQGLVPGLSCEAEVKASMSIYKRVVTTIPPEMKKMED
jgi:hypothetical protein